MKIYHADYAIAGNELVVKTVEIKAFDHIMALDIAGELVKDREFVAQIRNEYNKVIYNYLNGFRNIND